MSRNDYIVVHIITRLDLGGAQKVCLSLFKSSEKNLLISGTQGYFVDNVKNNNNVILIKELEHEITFNIFKEFKCLIVLIKELKKLKKTHPNLIIHTHTPKAGILGRWAAFFAGIKKRIHTIHGFGFNFHKPSAIIFYLIELFTSLITTHFICVSSEDVKIGKKLFPNFTQKHSIIRAAIDDDFIFNKFIPTKRIDNFNESEETFIFGTIACFKKGKNLIEMLQAFECVVQMNLNCKLEVIGDGELRNELETWIKEHNLTEKIILHGWQEQVAPIMLNWNAFLFTSLWEGLPCAIVEARLLKLPVLSYNTGGIHDIVIDGLNGFLYKKGNWQDLAEGMVKLIQDKNLYKHFKNFNDDLSDFSISKMIYQHDKLYKDLNNLH